jgi:hypothetical protein
MQVVTGARRTAALQRGPGELAAAVDQHPMRTSNGYRTGRMKTAEETVAFPAPQETIYLNETLGEPSACVAEK